MIICWPLDGVLQEVVAGPDWIHQATRGASVIIQVSVAVLRLVVALQDNTQNFVTEGGALLLVSLVCLIHCDH